VSADSHTIEHCRSCGGRDLRPVLDLGKTPLANRLLDRERLGEPEPTFPLAVVFCPGCALVQITETVSPEVLFRDYLYFSSVSDALLEHSRRHADALVASRRLGRRSRVIEAASNDGYLLKWFQPHGVEVLGIEPARNIAAVAVERGVPTRADFFGLETARRLVAEGLTADVVLGNNVLAHVADLNGFVAGAALLLRPGGIVELEFPWVVDLVDHVEFDTIYHEHLCYFSAHAIDALFRRHGLVLSDITTLPIHGGSLRVTGARAADAEKGLGGGRVGKARVDELMALERRRGADKLAFYADFGARVRALGDELRAALARLKSEKKRVVAYGASAKGSTLLNAFGIGREHLEWVADRSAAKQGRFTPGTHLEIVPAERLASDRPDVALLLTWNFKDEILKQQAAFRAAGGKFLVPVPRVELV